MTFLSRSQQRSLKLAVMKNKDNKDMGTNNIIEFNQHKQTMDSQYMELVDYDELRKKYWSHICPGVGMVSQPDSVCQRCLQTKPKGE